MPAAALGRPPTALTTGRTSLASSFAVKDGIVSDEEGEKHMQEIFSMVDTDGSGQISKSEFKTLYGKIAQTIRGDLMREAQLEDKARRMKKRLRLMWCGMFLLVGVLCVSVLANAGGSYMVYQLSKETKTRGATLTNLAGDTVSTAAQAFQITLDELHTAPKTIFTRVEKCFITEHLVVKVDSDYDDVTVTRTLKVDELQRFERDNRTVVLALDYAKQLTLLGGSAWNPNRQKRLYAAHVTDPLRNKTGISLPGVTSFDMMMQTSGLDARRRALAEGRALGGCTGWACMAFGVLGATVCYTVGAALAPVSGGGTLYAASVGCGLVFTAMTTDWDRRLEELHVDGKRMLSAHDAKQIAYEENYEWVERIQCVGTYYNEEPVNTTGI